MQKNALQSGTIILGFDQTEINARRIPALPSIWTSPALVDLYPVENERPRLKERNETSTTSEKQSL
jgi:hypothetical protein